MVGRARAVLPVWQPFDQDDENLYNQLDSNGHRLGFLLFMEHERLNLPEELNPPRGATVVELWRRKKAHWIGKGKKLQARYQRPQLQAPQPVPIPTQQAVDRDDQVDDGDPPPNGPPPHNGTQAEIGTPANNGPHVGDGNIQTPPAISPGTLYGGEKSPTLYLRNQSLPQTGTERMHPLSPTSGHRRDIAADLQKKLGGDTTWRFVRTIYQRSTRDGGKRHGIPPRSVWLFAEVDDQGHIQRHVVVKCFNTTSNYRSRDRNTRDDTHPHEIISEPGKEARTIETEIRMNEAIMKANCQHVLPYLGSGEREIRVRIRQAPDIRTFRARWIYTPLCQFEDVFLLQHTIAKRKTPLPEHYIWYFLMRMVAALQALQSGHCVSDEDLLRGVEPGHREREHDWTPIMHCDIKPDNIFLMNRDPTYKSYARPVLADFDSATYETEDQQHRARETGTEGWFPPEKFDSYVDSKNAPPLKWKVTIKTDLWTLGLVTLHLLLASNELPPEDWEGTLAERMKDAIQDPDSFQVVEEDKIPADYSLRLVRLVKRMLNYRPYDRPTLHDVQEEAISQLNRLNSQYGDNILRDHHTIVRELRGEFPQQKDEFTPNQVFVPEKRRRVPPVLVAENREQLIESYRREVQVWNNTPPECTSDQLSRAFARLERELPTEVAKTNMNALSSCAKAVAVMRKTVSPDEEQDQIVNEGEQQDTEELEEFTPLTSIMKDHALFQMSQLALRVWQNEPDGELRTAFWVINHAAVIGCWVLRLGEYPTPRPEHPSSMHKAVEDWIIYDPSGLWYRRT